MFQSSRKILQIILYCDEFVSANPIGHNVKKIEILASYFSLGKIPQKKRSLLSKINLAILCKPIYIEKYGLGKLFASLLDVIKKLKKKW